MAGSRSLTSTEERLLIKYIRRIGPRDRAVITTQLLTGFRIREVISLTVGQVLEANGQIKSKIGVRPRNLKGGYGNTRWVPVCPELQRALAAYLARRAKTEDLKPEAPLFLSRNHSGGGMAKPLCRSTAEKLIHTVLRRIGQGDLETLSTHSLRKTWARKLYEASGHDLILVKEGLGHSSVSVSQFYLACDRERLNALIMKSDWTRQPRAKSKKIFLAKTANKPNRLPAEPATLLNTITAGTDCLPGFEPFAA